MDIVNTISLESNSSDAGLLMIYDFMRTMGFKDITSKIFATPRKDPFRKYSDSSMLLQFLYQVFAAYYEWYSILCIFFIYIVLVFTRKQLHNFIIV